MRFIPKANEVLAALCVAHNQWGMMLFTLSRTPEDVRAAAPYLSEEQAAALFHEHTAFLLFDSADAMESSYWQTVGDDGPTKLNPYTGPGNVYAVTCSPEGQLLNENT